MRFIRRYFPSAESKNTLKATAKTDAGKASPQDFHLPNQGVAELLKRASFELSEWLNGLTVSPSADTPMGLIPRELADEELAAYTDKVFKLVNMEREKAGAASLERSDFLDEAADARAQDCASMGSIRYNNQPHTRPDGSRWFTVLGIDKNYNYGENAGSGCYTAEAQMKSWMGSSGHKANILKEDYTEIGIGCAMSEQGQIYTIQIFYRP